MRWQTAASFCLLAMVIGLPAWAQESQPPANPSSARAPGNQRATDPSAPKSSTEPSADDQQRALLDADAQLQIAVQQSKGDPVKLAKNLKDYLARFPDSPRRGAIYHTLMQAAAQDHDEKGALDYAQKIIAMDPKDTSAMYTAVTILTKIADEPSLTQAIDYDSRIIGDVSKANPDSRPQEMTLDDWQAGRDRFLKVVYLSRAHIEWQLQKNDAAIKDLNSSFNILPSSEAALALGEIAEEGKQTDEALRQYALAFVLSGQEQADDAVNQDSLRLKMGNLWRFTHNTNAGLGDIVLAAFDKNRDMLKANQADAVVYNKDVTDPLQFSLRQTDGKGAVKLADWHGKIVILNFWTTWCAYCRTMGSMLDDVQTKFVGRDDVVSLAVNADEDETIVKPFLEERKIGGTVVFADGLGQAFHIESIPTVIVLDPAGKIAYRMQGYAPDGFVDTISSAITKASGTQ